MAFFVAIVLSAKGMLQAAALKFQADEWVTECDGGAAASCSIIAAFRGVSSDSRVGSFALAVEVDSSQLAIVGNPQPIGGVIRVDKYPGASCIGRRYCLLASADAASIIRQLSRGAVILVDVVTDTGTFHSSLSTKGYQAGLAKIRAQGYHFPLY